MSYWRPSGRVNIKLILILILTTGAAGISLVVARQTHRGALSGKYLTAGEAAWESRDWPQAATELPQVSRSQSG